MQTRSKNNIFKPKRLYLATNVDPLDHIEPTYATQAQKNVHWRQVVTDEFNALARSSTWTLVPTSSTHNVVECKWLFWIKRHLDGTIALYKACLVAKGFHQRSGIDFHDKFSPVVKPTTICSHCCHQWLDFILIGC